MFNQNKENQVVQPFGSLPIATIKIPVPREVATVLQYLFNQKIGAVNISLEDLKVDGANLVITSIINKRSSKRQHDLFAIYEEDELKHLKRLMNEIIEEKFKESDDDLLKHYRKLNEEELENERLEQEILKELEEEEDKGWEKCWGWDEKLAF